METRRFDVIDEELTKLVKQTTAGRGPFNPFAIYHDALDLIIVVNRDCSHTNLK